MDNINKFRRLLFCLVAGLCVMLCTFLLTSCASPRNIEHDSQVDYSGVFQKMQSRMDSMFHNMKQTIQEVGEKTSNTNLDNETTFFSPPDSTGRQYPTAVSKTTANRNEKEVKVLDMETTATIHNLIREVSDLRNQLTAAISDKEKVVELSWWNLNRDKVYCVVILLFFAFTIFKRVKK